jgi:mRNA interferase MazF
MARSGKMNYRWSIYMVNLDPVIGSEQGKKRPVLIVSDEDINQLLPVVNIIPLTSYKDGRRIYANEVFLRRETAELDKDSIALCYQIRTIDKKRLITRLGEVKDELVKQDILDALSFQLGM